MVGWELSPEIDGFLYRVQINNQSMLIRALFIVTVLRGRSSTHLSSRRHKPEKEQRTARDGQEERSERTRTPRPEEDLLRQRRPLGPDARGLIVLERARSA